MQSPINIITNRVIPVEDIKLTAEFADIRNGSVTYFDNELKIEYTQGKVIYKSEEEVSMWNSAQFHFHSPSEHLVDGHHFDAEMHTVFMKDDGSKQRLALGILFHHSKDAPDLEFLTSLNLDNIKELGTEVLDRVQVHNFIYSLSTREKFNYKGSVTTPPCDEMVEWFVVKEPVNINTKQLDFFRALWSYNQDFAGGKGNNR